MTPVQKHFEKEVKSGKKLDLDTFGEMMDEFLNQFDCQMLITIPKGTDRPEIKENMGIGPIGALYFILKAITPITKETFRVLDERGGESFDKEGLADAICELIKAEIMDA